MGGGGGDTAFFSQKVRQGAFTANGPGLPWVAGWGSRDVCIWVIYLIIKRVGARRQGGKCDRGES